MLEMYYKIIRLMTIIKKKHIIIKLFIHVHVIGNTDDRDMRWCIDR